MTNQSIHYPTDGEQISCEGRKYVIGSFVKKGAFGATYECTDEWDNPLIAKILLPQNRPKEKVRDDWLNELQKLKLLRHPSITYIHEAFEYRDTFYLIIERCTMPLSELFEWDDFEGSKWVIGVARGVLQALYFMHEQGYVHKDIHAGNVFTAGMRDKMIPGIAPQAVTKVGDLGISRLEPDIRVFGTILAKWMVPPEYLRPLEFGLVGKQVDLYHTGLLLLSLEMNGVQSFTEDEIVAGKPRLLAEQLDSPFSYAIAKSLRRHVTTRTQTAHEFWRDLTQPQLSL